MRELEIYRATWADSGSTLRHDHDQRWAILKVPKGVLLNTVYSIVEVSRNRVRLEEESIEVIPVGKIYVIPPFTIHSVQPLSVPTESRHAYPRLSDIEN